MASFDGPGFTGPGVGREGGFSEDGGPGLGSAGEAPGLNTSGRAVSGVAVGPGEGCCEFPGPASVGVGIGRDRTYRENPGLCKFM